MSDQVRVTILPNCDFCQQESSVSLATVDGKTVMGPWANMCAHHFAAYGVGLGTGKGQRLVLKSD